MANIVLWDKPSSRDKFSNLRLCPGERIDLAIWISVSCSGIGFGDCSGWDSSNGDVFDPWHAVVRNAKTIKLEIKNNLVRKLMGELWIGSGAARVTIHLVFRAGGFMGLL
jgi:hypothetical protein